MEEKAKVLSLIVPTYNMERYIGRCLDSIAIAKEVLDRIEVLVIIDGSKDRSSEIAHSYEDSFPDSIKVIDKNNGNYGSCINVGLQKATGKFIKILDADDLFDTAILSDYISFLCSVDTDMILSDVCSVTDDNHIISSSSFSVPSSSTFSLDDLNGNDIQALFIHHITYKREALRNHHQTEGISYTDLEWTVMPSRFVTKCVYFPHPLYRYVIGREGQTVNKNVHARNMHMERDVAMNIIQEYLTYSSFTKEKNTSFAYRKILSIVEQLYMYYLLTLHKYTNLEELSVLDKSIETSSPELYSITDNYCIEKRHIKFKYVHCYRKNHTRNHIAYKLYDWYSKR